MIPGKGTLKHEHKSDAIKGVRTLKTSVIFGANASGKSNLIKAVAFGRNLVVKGLSNDVLIDYQPFRLDENTLGKNSRMEFEIQTDGKNYAYGFVFNRNGIVEEWLYEISKTSERKIFERTATNQYDLETLYSKNKKQEHQQFIHFTAKGTPDNQLFLRELFVRKGKENLQDVKDIYAVYGWFLKKLKIVFPHTRYNEGIKSEIESNEKLHVIYDELLDYFGTGVKGIALQDIEVDKVPIPNIIVDSIKEDLLNKNMDDALSLFHVHGQLFIFSKEATNIRVQKFMTKHGMSNGSETYFDVKDESDGTNRIIDFIPLIIDLLKGDNVFLVDEMERSLHPNLIYDIFDIFLTFSNNVNSQLIASTHESSLLTQKLFRKDEIWFAVKNADGSSRLYSLEDYNVRFDKEIRKDYLLGRYKAIPRLGSRDKLVSLKPEYHA